MTVAKAMIRENTVAEPANDGDEQLYTELAGSLGYADLFSNQTPCCPHTSF